MNMKSIAYWVATTLIALETFVGGSTDLVHGGMELVAGPPVVGIVAHLGYPVYILSILGVWKLLGAVVIVAPGLPRRIRRSNEVGQTAIRVVEGCMR
jgi:DoxX-like family